LKGARTLSEWWDKRYRWEHYVVGVLVGFLLGAMMGFPVGTLISTTRPNNLSPAANFISTPR
jgi:ABC-type nitrate/sulfonate/bicarbonate transport system permease component